MFRGPREENLGIWFPHPLRNRGRGQVGPTEQGSRHLSPDSVQFPICPGKTALRLGSCPRGTAPEWHLPHAGSSGGPRASPVRPPLLEGGWEHRPKWTVQPLFVSLRAQSRHSVGTGQPWGWGPKHRHSPLSSLGNGDRKEGRRGQGLAPRSWPRPGPAARRPWALGHAAPCASCAR